MNVDPVYVLNALLVVPVVCLPKTMLLTAGRVKIKMLVPLNVPILLSGQSALRETPLLKIEACMDASGIQTSMKTVLCTLISSSHCTISKRLPL